MFPFILHTVITALTTTAFLGWGRAQVEAQLDKMQQKVHFTPGAEAPLPPVVALTGAALLSGQLLAGRALRLRGWQTLLSLLLGVTGGAVLFLNRMNRFS
ncbi:MAG: hypothetical protein KJZ93_29595 [Caldilineaceae bacterium]|nr:hypothetical protein [Caldilineaceae bacterium]